MLTKQDLEEQREQIQNDIMCILDGIEDNVLIHVCQVVVDRINILVNKLEG